jgi:large subunit ribosomal protein L3
MGLGLIGKKLGMSQIFDEHGNIIPVTVIKAGPCTVVQKKTAVKEGYNALQIGFEEIVKVQRVNKPLSGHFKKANAAPTAVLKEFRVTAEDLEANEVGTVHSVEMFEPGDYVDVVGTSKGKGFAGVMNATIRRRTSSHGAHEYFEHGALSAEYDAGRVVKGKNAWPYGQPQSNGAKP